MSANLSDLDKKYQHFADSTGFCRKNWTYGETIPAHSPMFGLADFLLNVLQLWMS